MQNSKFAAFSMIVVSVFSLNACASITRGSHEAFVVETTPPSAKVSLSNGLTCTSPCSLKVTRKRGFHVKIEKEGYKTIDTDISTQVADAGAAGMAGNVIFGGPIGAVVDVSTGAMKKLKPNPLKVTLESASSTLDAAAAPVAVAAPGTAANGDTASGAPPATPAAPPSPGN